ncbi:Ubiquinone biosynthesis protein Coq4 [Acidimicrobiia bacterium]
MPISLDPDLVDVTVAGLLGACDVDDGPTQEQLTVLRSITAHLWNRDDLDLSNMATLDPAQTAELLESAAARRCFHELLVALEACRHPMSAAQVGSVEAYLGALGVEGPERQILRDLVDNGTKIAADDFQRFLRSNLAERAEPSLRGRTVPADAAEPELAAKLDQLHELPKGTLGWSYIEFYQRHRFLTPGTEASWMNHFFVAHDMTHVIAGIEPTGPGELALSAFQMAMNDNEVNRSALLASLIVHEVGIGNAGKLTSESGTLADGRAAELFGQELARGARCSADFSLVDHFELAALPLNEVRDRFGVTPPVDPADGHHHW